MPLIIVIISYHSFHQYLLYSIIRLSKHVKDSQLAAEITLKMLEDELRMADKQFQIDCIAAKEEFDNEEVGYLLMSYTRYQ